MRKHRSPRPLSALAVLMVTIALLVSPVPKMNGVQAETVTTDAAAAAATIVQPTPYTRIFGLGSISSLAFSPDGKRVLVGSIGRFVAELDVASGKILRYFPGRLQSVYSVAYSPDGTRIVAGTYKDALMWDAHTGRLLRSWTVGQYNILTVEFSRDSSKILIGSYNSVALWDAATGKQLRSFATGTQYVNYYGLFSPDNRTVLAPGEDPNLRFYNPSTGAQIRTVELASFAAGSCLRARQCPSHGRGSVR